MRAVGWGGGFDTNPPPATLKERRWPIGPVSSRVIEEEKRRAGSLPCDALSGNSSRTGYLLPSGEKKMKRVLGPFPRG